MIEAVLALTLIDKVILFLIGGLALIGAAFLVVFARRCWMYCREEEKEKEVKKNLSSLEKVGVLCPDSPEVQNLNLDGLAKRLKITREEEEAFGEIILSELRRFGEYDIPPGPNALCHFLAYTVERRIREFRNNRKEDKEKGEQNDPEN